MRCSALLFLLITLVVSVPGQAQDLSLGDDEVEPSPGPDSVIEVKPENVRDDASIQSRLDAIFSQVPDLAAVHSSVEDGVVVLEGMVEDAESRDRAEALAWRVKGVAVVVNRIDRNRALKSRLDATARGLVNQGRDFVSNAPVFILALLVVGLSTVLARIIGKADWIYSRLTRNWFLRDLWRQVLQLVIFACGLLIALKLLDATALLGSLLGALGIIGLAIGFATRDTVENYIASILLSIRQPFRREDHVLINDMEGKVVRLTPRATILMSLDGNHVRIPNATVFKATIVNFTRNPLRRLEFTVGVDTDLDLKHPRTLAIETLKQIPGVLSDPEPVCLVEALGDSNVVLKIQAWIDQRESDFHKSRSESQRVVKEAFDEAGIVMPEPIYNVNLRRGKRPSPSRPESDAKPTKPTPDEAADTKVDHTVEDQIREESRNQPETDLLDESAPVE